MSKLALVLFTSALANTGSFVDAAAGMPEEAAGRMPAPPVARATCPELSLTTSCANLPVLSALAVPPCGAQSAAAKIHAADDGLALTPPMGWYPWNTFGQEPQNESLIRETVDALLASGMKDAGYAYVGPDEGLCFSRGSDGKLTSNLKRYPSGLRGLGDAIHRKGLKYALYTDAGTRTCSGDMPGTKDHEYVDMQSFAEWRADYVKIDWCNTQGQEIEKTYRELHDAQHAAGRPIVHSLCSWGDGEPWKWAASLGHLWRTASDICGPGSADWSLAMKLTAINEKLYPWAGPGHWNDPDMLIVGMPGLSEAQNRTFFSLWCLMAAPLMAGNDLRSMTPETIRILTNPAAIAINQDPLGIQGHLIRRAGEVEVWAGKPLFDGSRALVLYNRGTTPASVDVTPEELDIKRQPGLFVRDVWRHADAAAATGTGGVLSFTVEPNDVGFFRIANTKEFPLPPLIVADTYLVSLRTAGAAAQELTGSLSLVNKGSAELPLWNIRQDLPAWLSVSVSKSGNTQTLTNKVTTAGLKMGNYHAVVRLDNTEPVSGRPLSAVYYDVDLEVTAAVHGAAPPLLRGLREVDHSQVELRGGFWGPRLQAHHELTLPHALDCLEKDGHVTNFDKAAGKFDGDLKGHPAFDSDLHKALEGALISLQHFDDSALRQRVEAIIDRILAAQQKDGFLISYYIVKDQDKRWEDLRLCHQMYNSGHFFEMAAAEQQLSGQPRVLDAAKRFADHIGGIFGPNKRYDVDGHEEVELALIKLYRATGERRYLDLAKFFLDERGYVHGTTHTLFDPKSAPPPVKPEGKLSKDQQREFWHAQLRTRNGRMQDHKPVIDQHEAVGHAVRAGYLYSAMTDVLRLMEAPGYESALDDLWSDVVSHKMYLTGSLGTGQYDDEGFGDAYLLPNESAYGESCAAITHILWQYRMGLLKAQAKYADLMEITIYNGMLAGISVAGDKFFYQNPLASEQGAKRQAWIGLSCCPTNLARLIPQLGGFVYAQGNGQVYVNLYAAGEAKLKLDDGTPLKLAQHTDYPWDGHIGLTVTPQAARAFELCLRVPGWAQGRPVPSDLYRFTEPQVPPVTLMLNGQPLSATPSADGYLHLQRTWQAGDVVELDLPMPVQRVLAHDQLAADRGKVALMRGPLVYCLEAADQPEVVIHGLSLPKTAELRAEPRAGLLGGITVLTGQAMDEGRRPFTFTAVPYYAWANRDKGAMCVWLKQAE